MLVNDLETLKAILEEATREYGWAIVLDQLFDIALNEKSLTPDQRDAILDFVPSLLEMGIR